MKESICACDKCKNMCKTQPCIGTPEDIVKIIISGQKNKLAATVWLTGVVTDSYRKPVNMIQPLALDNGCCAFLDENDMCTLHDLGLKPTEGKCAHHSNKKTDDFKNTVNYQVAMTWIDNNGINDPIKQLMNAVSKLEIDGNK